MQGLCQRPRNIGKASSAQPYQGFANEVYRWAAKNDPALAKELQWGGYFRGGGWPRDFMHLQRGGTPVQGGSWAGGFSPEYVKAAGLSGAGGLGDLTQLASATTPQPATTVQQAGAPVPYDPHPAVTVQQAGAPVPYDPRRDTPSPAQPTGSQLPGPPVSYGGPGEGAGHFGGTGLGTPAAPVVTVEGPGPYPTAPGQKHDYNKDLAGAVGALAGDQLVPSRAPAIPMLSANAYTPSPAMTGGDPQAEAMQRQALAQILMQLNSGKLFGGFGGGFGGQG